MWEKHNKKRELDKDHAFKAESADLMVSHLKTLQEGLAHAAGMNEWQQKEARENTLEFFESPHGGFAFGRADSSSSDDEPLCIYSKGRKIAASIHNQSYDSFNADALLDQHTQTVTLNILASSPLEEIVRADMEFLLKQGGMKLRRKEQKTPTSPHIERQQMENRQNLGKGIAGFTDTYNGFTMAIDDGSGKGAVDQGADVLLKPGQPVDMKNFSKKATQQRRFEIMFHADDLGKVIGMLERFARQQRAQPLGK